MKLAIALLVLAACGSDSFECAMGELEGAWRLSFEEVSGDCGPINETNAILTPGEVPANCTASIFEISDDKCEMTTDVTCTVEGGTTRSVAHAEQVSDDEARGSATLTLDTDSAFCQSTYNTRMRRL